MVLTLAEILETCDDWDAFCDEEGWDRYAVNEGGDDIEVELTLDQARHFGIIPT